MVTVSLEIRVKELEVRKQCCVGSEPIKMYKFMKLKTEQEAVLDVAGTINLLFL